MTFLRRLRGAVRNALVWGASWFGVGLALLVPIHLLDLLPVANPWTVIFSFSANLGVVGFLVGGGFSAFLSLAYRDRSLLEINAGRFALAGAVVAAVLSPIVQLVAVTSTGLGASLGDLVAGGLFPAVLGGITAGATIKLAQSASSRLAQPAADELEAERQEALAGMTLGPDIDLQNAALQPIKKSTAAIPKRIIRKNDTQPRK